MPREVIWFYLFTSCSSLQSEVRLIRTLFDLSFAFCHLITSSSVLLSFRLSTYDCTNDHHYNTILLPNIKSFASACLLSSQYIWSICLVCHNADELEFVSRNATLEVLDTHLSHTLKCFQFKYSSSYWNIIPPTPAVSLELQDPSCKLKVRIFRHL